MSHDAATGLAAGTDALAQGDWAGARDAFAAALESEETPHALVGMADACWWLGDLRGALEHRERAYAALRHDGQHLLAAALALRLCFDHHKHLGNRTTAAGWLARARRIIEREQLDMLGGYQRLLESHVADDLDLAEDRAREALELAEDTGDLDLELRALSQLGATLMAQGRIEEGAGHLDEAMAGALAQEGSNLDTVVFTSCNMITSCTSCADFQRAVRWIRAARRFSEEYGCPFLLVECRTFYGAVLVATGDWDRAEQELQAALELAEEAVPALEREALAALADLRLRQGHVEEAARLVHGIEDHPETAAVVGRLHLCRGDAERAATVARTALQRGPDRPREAELLEALALAELASSEAADTARGERIAAIGEEVDCDIIRARGRRMLGRTLSAGGDHAGAVRHLDAALRAFTRLEMPHEAARTRLAKGEALVADDDDQAAIETVRVALKVFEDLGARRDVDVAAQLLRSLGVVSARTRPRVGGDLTRRQSEVLELLGEGLSNPDIADRLVISRKTVEHHVSRVLAKLGVDNRAEAAVVAHRRRAMSSDRG